MSDQTPNDQTPNDRTPVDQVTIDQEQRDLVREQHTTSIFVEAGAGTGKTSAIVDRVVAMVAAGWLELRELAAITFTEAAAAELRDRIRGALDDAGNGRNMLVTSAEAMQRCAAALHEIDEAALTTLHGFAQRILAEHPLEAGLPPGFEVMDPIRARVEFEQRWSAFIDNVFADATIETALVRGLALGLSPERLHPIAVALHENHDRLPDPPPARPLPELSAAPVLTALDALLAHRRDDCRNDNDKLALRIDGIAWFRDLLAVATDELDLLEVLAGAPTARAGNVGKGECWDVPVKTVQAAAVAVDDAVSAVGSAQRLAVFETLIGRLITFVREAAADRRAAGALEFHDLLVFARDLLRDDAAVRAAPAARVKCQNLAELQ